MFNWDSDLTSKKLTIDDDQLTIKVKDGSGFKTSIGDQVGASLSLLHQLKLCSRLKQVGSITIRFD